MRCDQASVQASALTGVDSIVIKANGTRLVPAGVALRSPVGVPFVTRACSHHWGGWRCAQKFGQTKPSPQAVAGPPSRARMKCGRIFAATRRAGANFPDFGVDRR